MPPRPTSKSEASFVAAAPEAPRRARAAPSGPKCVAGPSATNTNNGPWSRKDVDYGILDSQIGFWIRRTNTRVLDSFSAIMAELNFRPVEVTILVLLGNNTGMTQVALGAALDTDQSTMVSLLSRLEQRKLVSRKRLSTDRRFQVTTLTPSGRRMLETVEDRLLSHNDNLLSSLSKPERALLIDLLRRLQCA